MSLLIGRGPVGGGNLTPVRDTLHVGDGARNEGLIGDVKKPDYKRNPQHTHEINPLDRRTGPEL